MSELDEIKKELEDFDGVDIVPVIARAQKNVIEKIVSMCHKKLTYEEGNVTVKYNVWEADAYKQLMDYLSQVHALFAHKNFRKYIKDLCMRGARGGFQEMASQFLKLQDQELPYEKVISEVNFTIKNGWFLLNLYTFNRYDNKWKQFWLGEDPEDSSGSATIYLYIPITIKEDVEV